MWLSLVEYLNGVQGAAGSTPVTPTTSKQSSLCFDFFMQKSHPPASLPLLFHKKSRSARLLGCKRPHDGSLSLPTFCEFILTRYEHSHQLKSLADSAFARFFILPKIQKILCRSTFRSTTFSKIVGK